LEYLDYDYIIDSKEINVRENRRWNRKGAIQKHN